MTKISKQITNFFINKNAIKAEEREIYEYCFTILLSTILNGLALLIIAILTKTILPTLFFAVSFLIMRSSAGGFHAKTHLGCFLTLLFFYSGFLCMYKFIPPSALYVISDSYVLVSMCIIFLIAPVDTANKRLEDDEKNKLAKRSIIESLIISAATLIIIYAFHRIDLGFGLISGLFVVSISLIIGKIINVAQMKKD